ncbi:MAG TPA: PEP-CTERM sorting domain-containing protein [Gemmatimonadaceae bacterium]|nr:PEP-CTERM sorting domain-containing protein [Gemmatimonadaceae bacterium]
MKYHSLAAAVILIGASAAPADAQVSFGNQCSTGSVKTCASFQAQVTALSSGRYELVVRVQNLWAVLADNSLTGQNIDRLGVLSPDLFDVTHSDPVETDGATKQGDPGSLWGFSSRNNSLNNLGSVEWAVAAGSNQNFSNGDGGIFGCLPANSTRPNFFLTCVNSVPTGWINFAVESSQSIDINQLQIAWGARSIGPQDLSVSGSTCVGGCGTEVIPEPITMVLLGSGLLGVGGAARRRRRKQLEIENV